MQPCACDAEIDPALTPPVARLRHRYVCEEMSTYQIARALGISRMVVLRNAHELGLPVRAYGPSRAVTGRHGPAPPHPRSSWSRRCTPTPWYAARWSATTSPRCHRAGRSGGDSPSRSR